MEWTVGKRLAVFSIREGRNGSLWVKAGAAFVNRDGSLNVVLDVLPLDGKLHVREAVERKDSGGAVLAPAAPEPDAPLFSRAPSVPAQT